MNNTFEFHRFSLLVKRKWLEFGKIYLITLGVALGVMLIAYVMAFWSSWASHTPMSYRDITFRVPFFFIFGFLFITVVASSYFAHLGQKSRTIIDLLIPASTFEKFISGVIFTAIVTPLAFSLLFFITDYLFVAKSTELHPFFSLNLDEVFMALYVLPLFVTSIFLLGSVYFTKFHYIKTALSVMSFVGIWIYVISEVGGFITSGRHPIGNGGKPQNNTIEYVLTVVLILLAIIIWGITYVRLREKEV